LADYLWNLHVHTYRSECAQPEMTIPAIAEAARALGLRAVGLTDHVNLARAWEIANLPLDLEERDRLTLPVEVLVGVEAMMISPAEISLPPEAARGLDYVMISANHYHLDFVEQPESLEPAVAAAHCLRMTAAAITCGYCDVIAHPLLRGSVPLTTREMTRAYTDQALAHLCGLAAQHGVALELNPRMVRAEPEFFRRLIAAAQAAGMRFTLGTDAHRLVNLAYDPAYSATPADLVALGLRWEQDLMPPEELRKRH